MQVTDVSQRQVTIVTEAGIATATLGPSRYNEPEMFALDGTDYPDYDERFDVYYAASDDGAVYYQSARILDDADDRRSLTKDEVMATAIRELQPILERTVAGEIESDDFIFAKNILTSPVWLHTRWIETGNVVAAQRKVLRDIWGIG